MIQALLTSNHPQINVNSFYTFLWCIWKSRNDARFGKRSGTPFQVFAAASAIMQGINLEVADPSQKNATICFAGTTAPGVDSMQAQDLSAQQTLPTPGRTIARVEDISGPIVFSDASWTLGADNRPTIAGLGIFVQMSTDRRCSRLCISAISEPVTSAIQAEALSLMLAYQIAHILHLQEPTFLTDSLTLANDLASQDMLLAPGHWSIRPQLAQIACSPAFEVSRIFHINRRCNFRAHHQAKLALKVQSTSFSLRCLDSGSNTCLNAEITALSCILKCKLVVHVRCC